MATPTITLKQIKQVIMTCACGDEYILGATGTVNGCDRCQGITRNPVDGTIIPDPFEQAFTEEGQQS